MEGKKPSDETAKELRNALRKTLADTINDKSIQSSSLLAEAERYIEKKVSQLQLRRHPGSDTSYFLAKGTNLLSDVIRTGNGNFYQIVTRMDDQLAGRIAEQQRVRHEETARSFGKGGVGKIRLAEHLTEQGSTVIAAKTPRKEKTKFRNGEFVKTQNANDLLNEAQHYRELPQSKHFSSVRDLVHVEERNGATRLYLLMDLHIRGDLINVLSKVNANSNLDRGSRQKFIRTIAFQIIEAVSEMHDAGIFHGDIKPENLLLSRDGAVVLADFGTASTNNATAVGYTSGHIPPEAGQPGSTKRNGDKYALGHTLLRIVNGLSGTDPVGDFDIFHIARALCDENPHQRPSLKEVLERGYFGEEKYSDQALLALIDHTEHTPGGAGEPNVNPPATGGQPAEQTGSQAIQGIRRSGSSARTEPAPHAGSGARTPDNQRPYSPSDFNPSSSTPSAAGSGPRGFQQQVDDFLTTGRYPRDAVRVADAPPASPRGLRQTAAAALRRVLHRGAGNAGAAR